MAIKINKMRKLLTVNGYDMDARSKKVIDILEFMLGHNLIAINTINDSVETTDIPVYYFDTINMSCGSNGLFELIGDNNWYKNVEIYVSQTADNHIVISFNMTEKTTGKYMQFIIKRLSETGINKLIDCNNGYFPEGTELMNNSKYVQLQQQFSDFIDIDKMLYIFDYIK